MGRKKAEAPRIMIRVNAGDKELLDELAEIEGSSISEICRHWISDRARVVRAQLDNSKAVKLMEGFLGKVQDDMLASGIPVQEVANIFGLGDLGESSNSETRPSNTGSNVSSLKHGQATKASKSKKVA